MRQPLTILVYPVRQVEGQWEYLLLKRSPRRDGFWQGVSGAVETRESLAEAASRELQEETGFLPSRLEEIHYSYSFPVSDQWREAFSAGTEEIVEHVFVAFLGSKVQPVLSAEHEAGRWCRFDEALQLLLWEDNKEALKQVDAYLRHG
ncbi:MAG: NUDIX pyrophosphatase [Chloroflexi bacterium]|nr:NUDIX pyrophosphatase [Chloroflexota bacterium]